MMVLVAAVRAGDGSDPLANDPFGNCWLAVAVALAFLSATAGSTATATAGSTATATAGSTAAASAGAATSPTTASAAATARAGAAAAGSTAIPSDSTKTAGGRTAAWIRAGEIPRGLDGGHASAWIAHRLAEANGETDVLGEVPDVREPLDCPLARVGGLVAASEAFKDIRVGRRHGEDVCIYIQKLRGCDVNGDRLLPESGQTGVGDNAPLLTRKPVDEMTYHRMIFGLLDDVPSLLDGRSVAHEPSRDGFFRLRKFGVGKRHNLAGGRRRDVGHARCGRRCKRRDSHLGVGDAGALGKAVDKPGQGRYIIGRPEKRPRNFRRVGRRRCVASGGRAHRRRLEIDLGARERSVNERLLFVLRRGHHIVANVPEQEIDLEPGRLDVLKERSGVRAVAPGSIGGHGAVPRRIGDEHVVGRRHGRKAEHLHASRGGSSHGAKWLIAGPVQYHQG